ncbi:MAG: hypothetical protein M3414_00510, partial [Pseudomonadota bacterium]|nr:hypothetical protein [Pseudomonadota bacterium]
MLPIYRAVAEGRLTQAEALVRIRAIKAQAHGDAQGVLLATRGWTAAPLRPSASAGRTQPAGVVLLWGLG